jgi:glycosyltransferase involved in cell wall biosynthesis
MKIILIGNSDLVIYNFRKELIIKLVKSNHEVVVICPLGEKLPLLLKLGCKHIAWKLNRHSINPWNEFRSFNSLRRIFKFIYADFILSFTIKPNIYSGIISRIYKIKHIPNITGLGNVFSKKNLLTNLIIFLYKIAFQNSKVIFLQNKSDYDKFLNLTIYPSKLHLVPGSGVNLDEFNFSDYPSENEGLKFLYLGRIMKQKGFLMYLGAAEFIKSRYSNVEFIVCGFPEKGFEKILSHSINKRIIEYRGNLIDVKPLIKEIHCLIQPSFYPEGISNVILEAASIGRPVITSSNAGCKDAVLDNETGFIFNNKNQQDLIDKIQLFINLRRDRKVEFSFNAREFVKKHYNRNDVINDYINYLN